MTRLRILEGIEIIKALEKIGYYRKDIRGAIFGLCVKAKIINNSKPYCRSGMNKKILTGRESID